LVLIHFSKCIIKTKIKCQSIILLWKLMHIK
jgi:hypothetical protein